VIKIKAVAAHVPCPGERPKAVTDPHNSLAGVGQIILHILWDLAIVPVQVKSDVGIVDIAGVIIRFGHDQRPYRKMAQQIRQHADLFIVSGPIVNDESAGNWF
jgi:hypothetical protein